MVHDKILLKIIKSKINLKDLTWLSNTLFAPIAALLPELSDYVFQTLYHRIICATDFTNSCMSTSPLQRVSYSFF